MTRFSERRRKRNANADMLGCWYSMRSILGRNWDSWLYCDSCSVEFKGVTVDYYIVQKCCHECSLDYKCKPEDRADCIQHQHKNFKPFAPTICPDPECGGETFVNDSREQDGYYKRWRECRKCGKKFYSREVVEIAA